MVVVTHHIGKPRHSTTAQKEKMTRERRRMLAGFSGGGSLTAGWTAGGEASAES